MKLNDIFEFAREAQGIKQSQIAVEIGVTQSAISKFEQGATKLSDETLCKIAEKLNIDENFINGKSLIPFKSEKMIKMLQPLLLPSEKSRFYYLILLYDNFEFISLIPPYSILEKIRRLKQNQIYAVAAKDRSGQVFLIRARYHFDLMLYEEDLESHLKYFIHLAKKKQDQFTFSTKMINEDLYEKIKDWTVEKRDIEPLFKRSTTDFVLTESEKRLVLLLREKNIDPDDIAASLGDRV